VATKRDVISITQLKSEAAELVRSVTEEGRTLIVTQNGTARVAVIDVAELDRMRDALALLKLIAQGEADVASGRGVSIDDAFEDALSAIDE
jgi:prevent-host-death family protein